MTTTTTKLIPQALATRRAQVGRHCSMICIAMAVARFTPAITLAEPTLSAAADAAVQPSALAMSPSVTLLVTTYFCPSRALCGSATATLRLALPNRTP